MFQSIRHTPFSIFNPLRVAAAWGVGLVLLSNGMALGTTPNTTTSSPQSGRSMAQLFRRETPAGCTAQGCRLSINQTLLRSGEVIVTRYRGQEQHIIQTGETKAVTLSLANPVLNSAGQVVIPADSLIEGEVVPVEGGGRFIANRIVVNGSVRDFAAQSPTLHDVKDPRETSVGAIATDAAIGAAGGVVLGQVLGQGRISMEQIIGGAAAGVVVGNVTAPRTVVISQNDEVQLQLTADFRL